MGEPVTSGVLIELDDRRRVSFGRVGRHDQYLAREESDGTIVLTPAVVMKVSDLEELLGPQKAGKVKQPKKVTVSARARTVVLSTVGEKILELVRSAGADGISAGDIVRGTDASRSRTFNELATLRRAGKVSNFTGKYVLGG